MRPMVQMLKDKGGATGTAEGAVRETSVGRYHDGKAQSACPGVFCVCVCVCVCVYILV